MFDNIQKSKENDENSLPKAEVQTNDTINDICLLPLRDMVHNMLYLRTMLPEYILML